MTDNTRAGSDYESDPLPPRVRELLTDALDRLDPRDRAERISWCQATGDHGVRMYPAVDDDLVEFRWAGKTLAMIPCGLLDSDEPLPEPQYIAEVPDHIPDEWTDQ